MKSSLVVSVCLVLLFCGILNLPNALYALGSSSEKHSFIPENGMVPDQETAIKIAEAVSNPIYGKEKIESEKPLRTKLAKDVWHVSGNLPKGSVGGIVEVEIAKETGCVLRVSHSK